MSFIDNLGNNLNELSQTLSKASKKVYKDSKKIKRIAKLRYDYAMEKRNLKLLYEELGRYGYEKFKGYSDESSSMEALIDRIDIKKARLSALEIAIENASQENFYLEEDMDGF